MQGRIVRMGVVTALMVLAMSIVSGAFASDTTTNEKQDLRPFYNVYPLDLKLAHIPADHPVLEMEFPFFPPQEVANVPMQGFWGSYYYDEETQRLAFAANLSDIEIVESYVHIDKRYVNMYRIVFQAKSDTMEVGFSDWGSSA